ncbi:MAG: hypothetical protein II072_08100 [Clostridia bacterium]|nr:hypothetical protein [Clostridia bacterium]
MFFNNSGNGSGTLTAAQQRCYNEIVGLIESYKPVWVFQQQNYDFVKRVYKAVLRDHPEYFWLSNGSSSTTTTRGSSITLEFKPNFVCALSGVPAKRRQLESIVAGYIRDAMRSSSDLYEQILYLHDRIVKDVDYVEIEPHCYDAYGCLVQRRAVCAGYAAAFQVLMQKIGVECGRVAGRSSSARTGAVDHEWNYIKLSDGYYFVDVTWDDPRVTNGAGGDNLSHDFFCLDLQELLRTHVIAAGQFIPQNFGKRFDYFKYRGWYLDRYSFQQASAIAAQQLRYSRKFYLKFKTRASAEQAKRDLIDSHKAYTIPGFGSNALRYGVSRSGLILMIEPN